MRRDGETLEEATARLKTKAPAEATQIGGDHYLAMTFEPWAIINANGLDFWEGNALKYLLRHKEKNGVEDLKKAIHYIEYIIERETKNGNG